MSMDLDHSNQIVHTLAGAWKGLQLYPHHHPAFENRIQALRQLLSAAAPIRLGLVEGTLCLETFLFAAEQPAAAALTNLLQERQLLGVEFHPGLTAEELRSWFTLLQEGQLRGAALGAALHDRQIVHIVTLAEDEETPEPDRAGKIYGRALEVVDQLFHDVRLGRVPESGPAKEVVEGLVRHTLADPQTLLALAMIKDYDHYTFTHSVNVSVIALTVGKACGLPESRLQTLGLGALLHDLGKLKIDPNILNKPGRLSPEEFALVREHPRTGCEIARQMAGIPSEALQIILGHHLGYNRRGYPAEAVAEITSPLVDMAIVADTYDALTTLRSYQRPYSPRQAMERLGTLSGTDVNPEVLQRFLATLGTFPVGSLVRLDSNEIGLVVGVQTEAPTVVELQILFDTGGARLPHPRAASLRGAETRRMVAEVDPFLKGVRMADYFN